MSPRPGTKLAPLGPMPPAQPPRQLRQNVKARPSASALKKPRPAQVAAVRWSDSDDTSSSDDDDSDREARSQAQPSGGGRPGYGAERRGMRGAPLRLGHRGGAGGGSSLGMRSFRTGMEEAAHQASVRQSLRGLLASIVAALLLGGAGGWVALTESAVAEGCGGLDAPLFGELPEPATRREERRLALLGPGGGGGVTPLSSLEVASFGGSVTVRRDASSTTEVVVSFVLSASEEAGLAGIDVGASLDGGVLKVDAAATDTWAGCRGVAISVGLPTAALALGQPRVSVVLGPPADDDDDDDDDAAAAAAGGVWPWRADAALAAAQAGGSLGAWRERASGGGAVVISGGGPASDGGGAPPPLKLAAVDVVCEHGAALPGGASSVQLQNLEVAMDVRVRARYADVVARELRVGQELAVRAGSGHVTVDDVALLSPGRVVASSVLGSVRARHIQRLGGGGGGGSSATPAASAAGGGMELHLHTSAGDAVEVILSSAWHDHSAQGGGFGGGYVELLAPFGRCVGRAQSRELDPVLLPAGLMLGLAARAQRVGQAAAAAAARGHRLGGSIAAAAAFAGTRLAQRLSRGPWRSVHLLSIVDTCIEMRDWTPALTEGPRVMLGTCTRSTPAAVSLDAARRVGARCAGHRAAGSGSRRPCCCNGGGRRRSGSLSVCVQRRAGFHGAARDRRASRSSRSRAECSRRHSVLAAVAAAPEHHPPTLS
eukprot:COSAG01_NODE_3966_length_5488_cov_65.012618_4_plen_715_part_00